MNGPVTDAMKLSRLPKWAKARIEGLERECFDLRNQVILLNDDQKQRADWHEHTIKTSDMINGGISTRFFVASNIDIELDNGLRLNINPTRDGDIRMIFDVERMQIDNDGRRASAVVIPQAQNALTIRKAYEA